MIDFDHEMRRYKEEWDYDTARCVAVVLGVWIACLSLLVGGISLALWLDG